MNRPVCSCVYHPDHELTNFCRNQECLLPMCPRCVSIHVQDHSINHSTPAIFTLDYMVEEIRVSFHQAKAKVRILGDALLKVQDLKKSNEIRARTVLKESLQRVRDEVQKQLAKIESQFLQTIDSYGEETVKELQQIDSLLQQEARKCRNNLSQLESDVFLKMLIRIQQSSHIQNINADLQQISQRIEELSKTRIEIPPNWFPLGSIKKSIRDIFGYKQLQKTAANTPSTSPIK